MSSEIEYKLLLKTAPLNKIILNPFNIRMDINQAYFNLENTSIELMSFNEMGRNPSLFISKSSGGRLVEISVSKEKFDELLPMFSQTSDNSFLLCKDNFTVARIRETVNFGFDTKYEITIKSKAISIGRNEVDVTLQKEMIKHKDFLFSLADGYLIMKTRYLVPTAVPELTWEIDIFKGVNEGLVIAEVEVPTLDTPMPPVPKEWTYIDITKNKAYHNAELTKHPISKRDNWEASCDTSV